MLGAGIGVVLAFLLTWLIAGLLYGVFGTDPLTFGAAAIVLLGVAVTASCCGRTDSLERGGRAWNRHAHRH